MPGKQITIDFTFRLQTNTRCGEGKAAQLHHYLIELGCTRPGIIVDSSIVDLPYVEQILYAVSQEKSLHPLIWRYDLRAEPDYDSLDRVKEIFTDAEGKPMVDCFVGIGGGSVIDFAKGLATVTVNPGRSVIYKGFPRGLNHPLPTIAIPTTAGTGSEATYNAVFIDRAAGKKLGINTTDNFPALAILDPLLTISCPPSVTASSGMDALVHTMESYAAQQANPMSRIFAKEAFKLIFNNLSKVVDEPGNLEVRAKLQFGAYLAGISLINSGSGPAGALSYPLGVHFNVPHGLAGAVFLPHIVEHNVRGGHDYSELYDLIDGVDIALSREDKNRIFVDKFFELGQKLKIPMNFAIFGVNQENLDLLLSEIDGLERAFAQNPLPFTVDDGKRLVRKMTVQEEQ